MALPINTKKKKIGMNQLKSIINKSIHQYFNLLTNTERLKHESRIESLKCMKIVKLLV